MSLKIHKFSKLDGSIVSGWEFPKGENSLGSFYGDMILKDGVLYGSAYGNGEGKKCQNRKCISSLFAIDVANAESIWMEEFISVNGSIVGGVTYHNGGIYVGGLNGDIAFIDIKNDDSYSSNPLARHFYTEQSEFPIISSIIKVSENSYCHGDISGKLKCFNLKSSDNNISSISGLNYWGELGLDGWIWSEIATFNNSYYAITLSGWLYRIDINTNSELLSILWEKELKFDGKPVAGIAPYSFRNQILLAVPFDKDKIIIVEDGTGSTLGEYPLKNGVQSLPIINDNLIFTIDRENSFRGYSIADRSQLICFDLNDMKGCD